MQLGIHLPHAGEQATPALIRRFAVRAEAHGLSDVWVSEHVIVPRATLPIRLTHTPATCRVRPVAGI